MFVSHWFEQQSNDQLGRVELSLDLTVHCATVFCLPRLRFYVQRLDGPCCIDQGMFRWSSHSGRPPKPKDFGHILYRTKKAAENSHIVSAVNFLLFICVPSWVHPGDVFPLCAASVRARISFVAGMRCWRLMSHTIGWGKNWAWICVHLGVWLIRVCATLQMWCDALAWWYCTCIAHQSELLRSRLHWPWLSCIYIALQSELVTAQAFVHRECVPSTQVLRMRFLLKCNVSFNQKFRDLIATDLSYQRTALLWIWCQSSPKGRQDWLLTP